MCRNWVQLRIEGDAVCVDTSYMRQIYKAGPLGMRDESTPYERAERYIEASGLLRQGFERKPDC
jgi:hypothetical protein